jgi:hypothetical protein
MKILQGKSKQPRRVLLYGTHGIGKSTWGSQAPRALVIATEDGCHDIGVDRTPTLTRLGDVLEYLSWLGTAQHQYKTCCIDSLDWLERILHKQVAADHRKSSIEEIPYGKGYVLAMDLWDQILSSLDAVRLQRGIAVILIAHARITKYADPATDSYDRYEPDLHKSISGRLQEWCDEVLFACYRVSVIKRDEGFGRSRVRAAGDGERIVHTCEAPTHLAKRRCLLPDELPLDFAAYAAALKAASGNGQDEKVKIRDGSSKPQEEVTNEV